jgi:hypothetical protein
MALHHLNFTLYHTTCIMIAPSHKHQLTNAFLILSKGVDIQYPLKFILDNLVAIIWFHYSLLEVYTFEF